MPEASPLTAKIEKVAPHQDSAFQRLYRINVSTTAQTVADLPWPSNWPEQSPQESLQLRLFHLNDIHSKVMLPDPIKGDTRVMAQVAARVKQARLNAADQAVLFLSAGDDHTGEVYDELLGYSAESFVKSLTYHAFSGAGLDAATLGNHEFDRGNRVLQQALQRDAAFPVLSANIAASSVLTQDDYAAAIIGTINGWRVVIFGLTSTADTKTHLPDDPDFRLVPAQTTLENFLPALAEKVDLVIALSHLGYQQQGVFGDQQLAEWLAQHIDVPAIVVGGHSHTRLHEQGYSKAHQYAGVPVVQAGSWGSHLGEVQLQLNADALNVKRAELHPIVAHDSKATEPVLVDEAYQAQVIAPVLAQVDALLNEQLAPAQENAALTKPEVLAQRYVGELALANFMTDAIYQQSKQSLATDVDVVAVNASSIVGGLPLHTPITFAQWHSVMPYADSLQRIELTPAQLRELVQSNAQRIVRPEERDSLDLTDFINRGFLHFSGSLRYRIALGSTPTQTRVTDITLHGKPLSAFEGQTLTLLVGDYIASGNQGWRGQNLELWQTNAIKGFDLKALPRTHLGPQFRDVVVDAMRASTTDPLLQAKRDGRLQISAD
ncbi:bifunctional metallophosphatase/5'-nucleotidase [Pseudidiomarina sediminum]|uniref:bifunctional metallophosphatase/5'-nucleotidase n=1 Tax=Pseudidiomarina sediminum TaxID=431675 RepID=UPI001C984EE4|nr:5'-nucleotidase C-terminal domain-containing protein [Pseudidiomarina sediminum]MBY6064905.1 5'-nucleotidase C-terminal domain-containing protein [Pseudidiomarina sediminum]